MKVVSLNTDEEVNRFLDNENIKVESITPVPNSTNGLIWALTYKEKVTIKKAVYKFGCGSYLGTTWSNERFELTDDEFNAAKNAFSERELGTEPWRFQFKKLGTTEIIEWR